jgi:formylglycine-generating enzyme required for sulfatase activity
MTSQIKPLRGGSWLINPRNCRSAFRNHAQPDLAYNYVGFRVVCLSDQKKDVATYKPLRGGSWVSFPRYCRSAYRALGQPDGAYGFVGFRVVCLPSLTAICQNDDLLQ